MSKRGKAATAVSTEALSPKGRKAPVSYTTSPVRDAPPNREGSDP